MSMLLIPMDREHAETLMRLAMREVRRLARRAATDTFTPHPGQANLTLTRAQKLNGAIAALHEQLEAPKPRR